MTSDQAEGRLRLLVEWTPDVVRRGKAQYACALALVKPLQQSLLAISEAHCVAVAVRRRADLGEDHFLLRRYSQFGLQRGGNIAQHQVGARRDADDRGRFGAEAGSNQSPPSATRRRGVT